MRSDDYDRMDTREKGGKTERQRGRARHNPYAKNNTEQQVFISPTHSLRVPASEDAREVAKKLTKSCREGDPPALLTIGNACINQAVKAIAISRRYLKDDSLDLAFQPAFRDESRSRASIAFYISAEPWSDVNTQLEVVELSVASTSKPNVVAGAIAGKIRESKQVYLSAIGIDAVANAVLAVGNARLYLEEDNLDIKVQPEFVHIEKYGRQMNGLRFCLVTQEL